MPNLDRMSSEIVGRVLNELRDRKGFSGWYDEIDNDIQCDIEDRLIADVKRILVDYV